jgi:hypothetical protein
MLVSYGKEQKDSRRAKAEQERKRSPPPDDPPDRAGNRAQNGHCAASDALGETPNSISLPQHSAEVAQISGRQVNVNRGPAGGHGRVSRWPIPRQPCLTCEMWVNVASIDA